MQHRAITLLLGCRLHHAPVQSPRNVLDIATGTGIWAIQFAHKHPESTVIGTDISLIQPAVGTVPSNVSFVREDSEKDAWIFPKLFDFVFLRIVFSCFDDHRVVMQKAFDNLKPGGWIEFNDFTLEHLSTDGSGDGTAHARWTELMVQAAQNAGRDFHVAKKYKQWLLEIGFVDVVEEVIPVPSRWPNFFRPSGEDSSELRLIRGDGSERVA